MVKILFSRRAHPGSLLIRACTWSDWSHVNLFAPDGSLVGAAAPHGVQPVSLEERLDLASAAASMCFPGDEAAAYAWALTQVGKPYDWLGVAGVGLHRDWEEDDKWFCSEFAGKALKEAGFMPYRSEALKRLVPQHLWMLDYPVTIIK